MRGVLEKWSVVGRLSQAFRRSSYVGARLKNLSLGSNAGLNANAAGYATAGPGRGAGNNHGSVIGGADGRETGNHQRRRPNP